MLTTEAPRAVPSSPSSGGPERPAPTPVARPSFVARLVAALPEAQDLAPETFAVRHRIVLVVAWLQVPFLILVGIVNAELNLATMGSIAVVQAIVAGATVLPGAKARAILASVALFAASAVLIYLSGGMIESHLHIFAMLPFVALYQDWRPLLASVGFVVVHHVGVSLFDPTGAFDHHAAQSKPLLWAFIHAGAVLVTVVGLLALWKVLEESTRATMRAVEAADLERLGRAADAERFASELGREATQLAGVSHRVNEVASVVRDTQITSSGRLGELSGQAVEASDANEVTRSRVSEGVAVMNELQVHSQGIERVIVLISEIAERTKLLALNATIEASRAGEAGRGFAVVASEVRDLATQSMDAASEIRSMLTAIQSGTSTTVAALDQVASAVDAVQAVQAEVVDVARAETASAEVLANQVRELTSLSEDLATAAEQMSRLAGQSATS
ncbi:MAG: methyl-accepting chemotaxis protein [Acidimicrobiales bacterium]